MKRVMVLLAAVALIACGDWNTDPNYRCVAAHTDTLGVIKRVASSGRISECVWLLNDSAYCRTRSIPPTCVVGSTS